MAALLDIMPNRRRAHPKKNHESMPLPGSMRALYDLDQGRDEVIVSDVRDVFSFSPHLVIHLERIDASDRRRLNLCGRDV